MGDRRIAEIKTSEGSLYVYTHWDGESFPEMTKEAIKIAEPRWDDESYGVRIVVDQLTKGGRDEKTGYGLALTPCFEDEYNHDNPSIIIDFVNQRLTVKGEGSCDCSFEELKV